MSSAVTTNQLELMFELIGGEVGDDVKLHLQHGSPTNGRAWRIYQIKSNGGLADYFQLGDGYLGWTKREAAQGLRGLYYGLIKGKELAERGQL